MKEKCKKYESLFIFGSEQELAEHIENCPDCKKEHEKMQAVASLVKEVGPEAKLLIEKRRKSSIALKAVAGFVVLFVAYFAIAPMLNTSTQLAMNSQEYSVHDSSMITQMGLPTDEYGLLIIE